MRKTFTITVLILVFSACGKDFLDLAPVSNPVINGFYKTAADMEIAVNSAYASLQADGQYRSANWQVGEVRSDNTWNWEGGGNLPDAEIDQFREGAPNSILNDMWLETYSGILRCNIVIDRIQPVIMNAALKKRFIGEVLFLRSLMYFNLVRTFGPVPLVLKEVTSVREGYTHGRRPVDEVYARIENDLRQAAEYLPSSYRPEDLGRATSGAAKSLLGKVYLTEKKFAEAAAILKEVVDAQQYSLLPVYNDLWLVGNANHAESIFEVQFKKGGLGTGSPYHNMFAPRNSELAVTVIGFAYGKNLPNKSLLQAYESGDQRKKASVAEWYVLNGDTVYQPYTIKYRDIPFTERDSDNNWTVLRYADVLLMYAEAFNELNNGPVKEAYDMVNAVRRRAGLSDLSEGMDKTSFSLALERERRVELAFEGHRWFDLLRTGRALSVMNEHFNGAITIKPYQLLFPVPQSQINVNPSLIIQNDGY